MYICLFIKFGQNRLSDLHKIDICQYFHLEKQDLSPEVTCIFAVLKVKTFALHLLLTHELKLRFIKTK